MKMRYALLTLACACASWAADAPAVAHQPAPGRTIASFTWGTGESSVGRASEEEAVCDFTAPTSFLPTGRGLYLLDAPNFRLLRVDPATGRITARAALAERVSGEVMLYTDLALLPEGWIAVASSREARVLLFTPDLAPAGMIAPAAPVRRITKLAADARGRLLLEDPAAGRLFLLDPAGRLLASPPIACQPHLFPDGRLCRFEITESPAPPHRVTAIAHAPDDEAGRSPDATRFPLAFDLPVQNLILLGGDGRTRLHVYAVLGSSGDVPVAARAVKATPNDGIVAALDLPLSPEMLTLRYVRETADGAVLFAAAAEDRYTIRRHPR